VVVHEPIALEKTGDRQKDLEAGVAKINAFVEARIRERPAEWFWVHKRWPREAYARKADA
jgi:KDO2-lipid IV(A) lauroyltransferase